MYSLSLALYLLMTAPIKSPIPRDIREIESLEREFPAHKDAQAQLKRLREIEEQATRAWIKTRDEKEGLRTLCMSSFFGLGIALGAVGFKSRRV